MNISATVIVGSWANISTATGSHQATCSAMVKTTIDDLNLTDRANETTPNRIVILPLVSIL